MGSAYSTNTFTCHPSLLSALGALIARGKLSAGFLATCRRATASIAQHAGGGAWEATGHLPRAAGGQGNIYSSRFRISFGFRFSWSPRGYARHATKFMAFYICGGISPPWVVLNHCEGLRQAEAALLPTPCDLLGRAFLCSQGSCFSGF